MARGNETTDSYPSLGKGNMSTGGCLFALLPPGTYPAVSGHWKFVRTYDAIADEILRLQDMRKQAEVDSVVKDEQMRLIQDLQDFIHQQPTTITEFDETLVKRLITKITVFEDHFTIVFKSGVTIEINA